MIVLHIYWWVILKISWSNFEFFWHFVLEQYLRWFCYIKVVQKFDFSAKLDLKSAGRTHYYIEISQRPEIIFCNLWVSIEVSDQIFVWKVDYTLSAKYNCQFAYPYIHILPYIILLQSMNAKFSKMLAGFFLFKSRWICR